MAHPHFLILGLRRLRELGEDLAGLVFPDLCAACREEHPPRGQRLCLSCKLSLPLTDHHLVARNGMMLRMEGRAPLVAAAAMCHFVKDSLVQEVLHRIKYRGDREAALELGRLYGQELAGQDAFREVSAVVPVPLHAARLHRRGYNQSAWFGRGVAEGLGCDSLEDALERVRDTGTQTRKTLAERQANVAAAFRLRDPSALEGRYVLLVDDVFTTGATLEACAAALLQVPGLRLGMVTLAVATPD
jgi:ComF family protein